MSKTDLLVFRVSSTGIRYSKPCSDCIKTMKNLNYRRVYYSLDNGTLVGEKVSSMFNSSISQMARHLRGDF